ncbi:hypothetical protein CB1_000294026 [Camelus ferus]|nr:hypothetical protein CB1_000294026 [Camelus ferus]
MFRKVWPRRPRGSASRCCRRPFGLSPPLAAGARLLCLDPSTSGAGFCRQSRWSSWCASWLSLSRACPVGFWLRYQQRTLRSDAAVSQTPAVLSLRCCIMHGFLSMSFLICFSFGFTWKS